MMSIVYFHGYRPVIPLLFDQAYAYLENYLNSLDLENKSFIFVGTSLGGYWANEMANKYCIPTILINPSCQPSITLVNYNNPLLNTIELAKYIDLRIRLGIPRIVMLAKNDSVIDYRVAESLFDKKAQILLFENADHRFELAPIAEYVIELYNNLTGCQELL